MKHPPQESDVIASRPVSLVGIGFVVATIAGALIAYAIGSCTARDIVGPGAIERTRQVLPDVNAMERTVYATEAQGLATNRQAEAALHTYGWVDRERGIVRVPLEVALQLYLQGKRPPQQAPQQPAGGGAK